MRKSSLARSAFALLASACALGAGLGGARPAHADAPAGGNPTEELTAKKNEKVRFYGFGMEYAIYDGSALNAANYSNELDQYFLPSWNFGKLWLKNTPFKNLGLAGRFTLGRVLTGYDESSFAHDSDQGPLQPCSSITPSTQGGVVDPTMVQRCNTNQVHRWDYGDVWLTLRNPKIYTIPKLLVNISPSVRVVIPASLQSRKNTLMLGTTTSVGLSRAFLGDKVTIGYSAGLTLNAFGSKTPVYTPGNENNGVSVIDRSGGPFIEAAGGSNSPWGVIQVASIDYAPLEKLSFSLLYIYINSHTYALSDNATYAGYDVNTYDNGMAVAGNSGSNIQRSVAKDSQWFWATAGYQALDWLNLSVSLITISPARKPDGTLRQPFLSTDYNAFSSINVGASVSIEKVAAKLF